MDTLQAIFQRFSCRSYKKEKMSEEDRDLLLQVALAAPTARNLQELRFHWIENPDLIEEISTCALENLGVETQEKMAKRGAKNLFYSAPHVLVISAYKQPYAGLDAGIAAQSVCIAAEALGLRTCMIGLAAAAFQRRCHNLCEKLHFAEGESFKIAIAIGYSDLQGEPHVSDPDHVKHYL